MVKDKGFTLVEVVVAIFLLSILFGTLFSLYETAFRKAYNQKKLWQTFKNLDTSEKLGNCSGVIKHYHGYKFKICQKQGLFLIEIK